MPPSDAVPFSPIAITGRACLLPGAHTPEELFALARGARDLLRDAPAGRWRAPDADVLSDGPAPDHAFTKRGGYVEGFAFDPQGYAVEPDALAGLDPLTQWVLDTGRRALADAGASGDARTGAVLGNLSLPSSGLSRFAESVWLEGDPAAREALGAAAADPRDRFMSGLPAHLLASALGLGLGGYALDAACASSLYAVELACRALQAGRADRMLAGAVSRADDLFLHVGFCALGAMSRTGQSRPFHADADGLVCGEGCGFVVLERLEDAVAAGRTIHGVIRGVGLANDGRGKGILAPSADGQARSMRAALAMAGLAPEDVAYVECHATGTTLGDATELDSMRAAYGDAPRTIGSLKGNLGHLITAAGVAGLIKLLESLREGELLPSPHTDRLSPAVEASPFEVLGAPRPWTGPRRAGLSAFGFGGNDAHLIVEAHDPSAPAVAVPAALERADEVVVVALGARVGAGRSRAELEAALFEGAPLAGRAEAVRLPFASLRFPPADLQKSSAQQTMLLAAALEATEGLALPRERTGVFVGYGCDPEIARWGARWRVGQASSDAGWIDAARDVFAPPLEAPHVVGVLPNMPANRLSSQLDLVGPSHTVSAEEQSGVRALEIALDALRRQDLDAAIVGAVDLSDEPVHRAALHALGESADDAGDAALVLVLKRRADAEAEGLPIFASVDRGAPESAAPIEAALPRAHAAKGLLDVAVAVLAAARARHPGGAPWSDAERALDLRLDALGAAPLAVRVRAHGPALPPEPPGDPGRCLELSAHPGPVALPPRPDRAASPSATASAPSPSLGSAAQAGAGAAPSRAARASSSSATPVASTEAAAMPSSPFQTMAP
ncbi:MAG TPA: beta-ketoacyl synthase N-terminal-like domain-containing protein, partial [Polyangiaceae bacterium LLY-WYZ-15_(1-7)]|nr:beta-ketoacyl synthase N-terminal-like domain-containing protein [Polyangiaceae bacterium LLY-WYZ-15_(1-7)]